MGMIARIVLALLLLAAWPVEAAPPVSPGEEAERLRADMEGQAERLRLTVETFMTQQERKVDDLRRTVLALSGLCAVLALVAGGLALAAARQRRVPLPPAGPEPPAIRRV